MARNILRAISLLALTTLSFASSSSFAEMSVSAIDQAPRLQEQKTDYKPLPADRLQQLSASARDYEFRAQYGLLDSHSQFQHQSDLDSQRNGLMQEMMRYQADGQLKILKTNAEKEAPNSVVLKSGLVLGTAYLFANGKTFTAKLTDDTEVSGNAKLTAGTHAVNLNHKNISPLNLSSGIGYERDASQSPMLNASVSKEILPHIMASVGQKKSLISGAATPSESTGQIRFGASF